VSTGPEAWIAIDKLIRCELSVANPFFHVDTQLFVGFLSHVRGRDRPRFDSWNSMVSMASSLTRNATTSVPG
jgi:hypothetical protein